MFATGCATVTEIKDFSMVQVVMREEGGQVTLLSTSQANAGSYRFGQAGTGNIYGVVVRVDLPQGWETTPFRAAQLRIPITLFTFSSVPGESSTLPDRDETYWVEYGAYRITAENLGSRRDHFYNAALSEPSGKGRVETRRAYVETRTGPAVFARMETELTTDHLDIDITQILKEWAAGEPNLGILVRPVQIGPVPPHFGIEWVSVPPISEEERERRRLAAMNRPPTVHQGTPVEEDRAPVIFLSH